MHGVRSRQELAEFGLSRRLAARLGAMLSMRIEVSPAVLEAATPRSRLEQFLLSATTLREDLGAELMEQAAAEAGLADEGLLLTLLPEPDGWRIIALKEEVLAEAAWEKQEKQPAEATENARALTPTISRREREHLPPALVPAGGEPAGPGDAGGQVFSEGRLQSLRLTLLTSADAEARTEALKLICYSPLANEEKTEAFFQALNDADVAVRATAGALLREVGLDVGVSETLRTLSTGSQDERVFAVERLGKEALAGRGISAAAAVVALVAQLRLEPETSVRRKVLQALEEAAGFIAGSAERTRELVRLLLANLGPHYAELAIPVRRLIARVGELLPDEVAEVLWKELESTPDRRIKILLLTLLAELAGADRQRIAGEMAEQIAMPEEKDADFRAFGAYMHRLGPPAVDALVEVYPKAAVSQRKYIVRLLDDICRYGHAPAASKERVAGLFLRYLAAAGRDLRITIMSAHLARDEELSDETRAALAALFLDNVHDVHMPTDVDNVEYTIARMGFAAAVPLMERLGARYALKERSRAARLLGELGLLEGRKAPSSRAVASRLEEMLRRLEHELVEGFRQAGCILVAQGKICSSGAVKRDTVAVMSRKLEERLAAGGQPPEVYEAAGWTAASPKASEKFVAAVMGHFFEVLERPEQEIPSDSRLEGGIKIYELGSEASYYTDLLPAVLEGLTLIYLGQRKAAARRVAIVGLLLRKWREVTEGQRVWGPGNITELVQVLRRIGTDADTDTATRISLLKALGRRLYQIPVMEAMAEVLASDDSSGEMARLASAFVAALLKRRDEDGRFEEDERAEVLSAIGRVALRRHLDTKIRGAENIRETVTDLLLDGLKDGVAGCQEVLLKMRDADVVPAELRRQITEALRAYQSIVVSG